ncbi:MAG: hypothetical protein ACT4P5_02260 [Armatimonadota bacterium]
MPKTLSAGLVLEKNRLDPQSSWVELYQVETSTNPLNIIYLTNHPIRVVYQNAEYQPYPIRHEAIQERLEGGMQKIAVHIPNVLREVQAYLEYNDGLRGRKVTLIVVNKDKPTLGDLRQTFIIEASSADERIATFVLGKPIPVNEIRLPGRVITRDLFPSLAGV